MTDYAKVIAEAEAALASGNGKPADPATYPVVAWLRDVAPEAVSWLWARRVAAGKLTLYVGDPEAGKSTLAVDLAAHVTTGRPFPDGAPCARGDVLYCTLEDGLADTIRPRLDAAGADVARVHSITGIMDEDGERCLALPADLRHVEAVVRARGVQLLILDPLKGYMESGGNEWRDGDVRRVLSPLAHFAERTGVAVVAIVHLTKAAGVQAAYRVSGSIAFLAAARSVLLAAPDPDDPDSGRRVFAPLKSSLCRRPPSLTYTLAAPDGTDDGPARVVWGGESAVTARQALAAQVDDGEERSQTDEAAAFLLDELADEARPAAEVQRLAKKAGISEKALRRGRERLGIRPRRVGFGRGGEWVWSLPASSIDAPDPSIDALDAHTQGMGNKGIYGPSRASMEAPEAAKSPPDPALLAELRDLQDGMPDLSHQTILDRYPGREAAVSAALDQLDGEGA